MKTTRKPAGRAKPIVVEARKGEGEAETMARVMTGPFLRHGIVTQGITGKMIGKIPGDPQFDDFGKVIKAKAELACGGDMTLASNMLTAQAISLDSMFTELTRRATMNLGDYPLACERYARLAFKAQANCRASLEVLVKLHQPREQTVRHVHVNEGAQAVIADEFHHHAGASENEKASEQSHATGAAGERAALPSPDPLGNGMPVPGRERAEAMPNARRDESRRPSGQPKCLEARGPIGGG